MLPAVHPAGPAADRIVLREPTYFTEIAQTACEWEAAGGIWKVMSYAFRFFALVGSFCCLIGIPFYIQADREITLLSFEATLREEDLIIAPEERAESARTIDQLTQERDHLQQSLIAEQATSAELGAQVQELNEAFEQLELENLDAHVKWSQSNSKDSQELRTLFADFSAYKKQHEAEIQQLSQEKDQVASELIGYMQKAEKLWQQLQQVRSDLAQVPQQTPTKNPQALGKLRELREKLSLVTPVKQLQLGAGNVSVP